MSSVSSPQDPRVIWQSQGKEHSSVSIQEIRLRAYAMQKKVHRNLIATIVFGSVLLVFAAIAITRLPYTSPRVITAALMVLISIVIYRAYRAFWSPEMLPPDAVLGACLDFYRRELSAQHRAVAFSWWRSIPDVLVFFFVVRIAVVGTFRYEFARIALPVLFGLLLLARHRKARSLKRELSALNNFEKENQ